MIKENSKAPEFELKNLKEEIVKLTNFAGKPFILYFYPKDDTPGCTTEACNFRDDFSQFNELGIEIVGVSPDSSKSHQKFAEKHHLPFTLLSDEGHKVAEKYEVWGKKKFIGKEYDGIYRTTFLIDKNGNIAKVFEGVKPANHSQEVLSEAKKLLQL
ncbi:MAG: thioredoxin-dependent thiol peroxidase [Pelolinea sp.]|nr:thioredoxin-dependent thiol peroxidase [Pelolinea sp.]